MSAINLASTAYRFVFSNLRAFITLGLAPIIAMTLVFTLEDLTANNGNAIPKAIAEAFFAYLWHRYYLLGKEQTRWYGPAKLQSEEDNKAAQKLGMRFGLWSIGLVGIGTIAALILIMPLFLIDLPMSTSITITAVLVCIAAPLTFRILPFFPALAVGKTDVRFRDAFAMTRGHTLSITIAFIIAVLPLTLLNVGAAMILFANAETESISFSPTLILANFAMAALSLVPAALGVTVNSEIFRRLSDFRPQETSPA